MSEVDSRATFYRQGSWMVIATFVSGVLMFAVQQIAWFWMRDEEYGLFGTLLMVLNLMMIPALGLQPVFAQQTAAVTDEQQQHDLARSIRKVLLSCLYLWMGISMLVILLHEPIIKSLKIGNPAAIWIILLICLPQLWLPVMMGILQGKQNFTWLGTAAIANGAGRFITVGLIVTLLGGQAAGATMGVLIGLTITCILAGWHSRVAWLGQEHVDKGKFEAKLWLIRIVPLTFGLGAGHFMLSADMLAARAILPGIDSGPYSYAGTIGRGLVIFTLPLAAVMFPKLIREDIQSKQSGIIGQTFLATMLLGVLTALACSGAAWALPSILNHFDALTARREALADIVALIPFFVWSMLPLALANVFVAALMARERYRAVPWLVAIAIAYGLTLVWLTKTAYSPTTLESWMGFWYTTDAIPPSQQTIILTLGGFNLAFLGTAAALAKRYAAPLECR